jgi:hypothetical protein
MSRLTYSSGWKRTSGNERAETNERKRNNRTCTSLHQGRCQKCCGVLGHIFAYLMLRHAFLSKPEQRVQRPFALEVTAAAGQSCRRVYHFSRKSSSNISCTSSFFQEMADFSTSPTSTVLEHRLFCQTLRLERHLAYHLPLLKYLLLIGADVIAFGGMG